jgi:peptidoglycan hydrolase-like protein with peptidoglycan-binding domain
MADYKKGMTGVEIYVLQEELSRVITIKGIGIPFKATGKFDQQTEDNLKAFQKEAGLEGTGIADLLTLSVLFRWNFEFSLAAPTVVAQPTSRYHCWAASTSSWLTTKVNQPNKTMQELIAMAKKVPGALDPESEGLWTKGWSFLKVKFGMQFDIFGGTKGKSLVSFSPQYLLNRLKAKGQLLMSYNLVDDSDAPAVAHTVVAYGFRVKYQADEVAPQYLVEIMDPWPVDGQAGLRQRSVNEFKMGGAVLVLW